MNKDIEKAISRLVKKLYEDKKLPVLKDTPVDDEGRSYEDNYYTQCLSCGRCVLVGKCCDEYITQSMIDKED